MEVTHSVERSVIKSHTYVPENHSKKIPYTLYKFEYDIKRRIEMAILGDFCGSFVSY